MFFLNFFFKLKKNMIRYQFKKKIFFHCIEIA